ncbi:MAG: hypothetical protein U9R34_04735 [Nanoarchaeota archaeon]|nr:hypothetical protein [Nanoarchaeota archaeon]
MKQQTKLNPEDIAKTYEKYQQILFKTLNVPDSIVQEQMARISYVVGVPSYPCYVSDGVNERGAYERFVNNRNQVVLRAQHGFATGTMTGDVERIVDQGIILFSDDRKYKSIFGGFEQDFIPRQGGNFPVTEALQIIIGDYTTEGDDGQRKHENYPSLKWDIPKIIRNDQFKLHEHMNLEKFSKFVGEIQYLEEVVKNNSFESANSAADYFRRFYYLTDLVSFVEMAVEHKTKGSKIFL